MKPTKIISEKKVNQISWTKPKWLISENRIIVLSNGCHSSDTFEGTCLPNKNNIYSLFNKDWKKEQFKPLEGALLIEISN